MKYFFIKPSSAGKQKKSISANIPSELVKALKIRPQTTLFLLKVCNANTLELRILRVDEIDKDETNMVNDLSNLLIEENQRLPVRQVVLDH